ncbi:p8 [Strawberry pallidosis-associated virus]|uniref:Movement protein n=1 Tax=Strawberry pallidosis-associated virus TaxID=227507 RepID=Q6JGW2_9CLOS|nr:p8 [Strawberry pallidosis-associated virus]AAS79675.1 p8 [Strawberry pallidosis-associated virus]AUT14079.1 movement protein [Strawberry pallidosis-associated virus]QNN88887.1 p8 [Strawberry pallidosis-associated virus]UDP24132.1 p8 [Strawberry pallidosis-associated virus]WGV43775.1 p8 [Strawberry pallidosis-associated virus]
MDKESALHVLLVLWHIVWHAMCYIYVVSFTARDHRRFVRPPHTPQFKRKRKLPRILLNVLAF